MQAVFDGHNDVLLRLWESSRKGGDPVADFVGGTGAGHIDLPRARAGGLAGGLSAIFVPSGRLILKAPGPDGHYETPLSEPVDHRDALDRTLQIAAIAFRIERAGGWRLCRSIADIRAALAAGIFAAVLHIEGAEAIGPDLAELETLHAAGLRSLGPVWSRHNIFGHGVPFAWPKSPDTAPGLTEAGFALVRECDRLGIAIDLAHITERGFWDVARTTSGPLIASHSNAHALTEVARNLTDRQLDAIRERRGIVGLNYATTMLRPDGQENADTPLADLVRHVDYLVARIGLDCVGLGSDFDGATIPKAIGDAAGTQSLVQALGTAGYGEEELAKICRENWLRVLGEAWHEAGP
jgi:membrane dipeptidase